jgi:hypothetical protein
MRLKTKTVASMLALVGLVGILTVAVAPQAQAYTTYCGHDTDGLWEVHAYNFHFSGAGRYMHNVTGVSRNWLGVAENPDTDGVYCTS